MLSSLCNIIKAKSRFLSGKKLLLFLYFTFYLFNSYSQQAPGIEWQNTIGGSGNDFRSAALPTIDNGYILTGTSTSNISGDKTENCIGGVGDYWVVKLDNLGNIQWQNTIGGTNNDALYNVYSIQQTSDGGYILGGFSSSDSSGDKTENNVGYGADYWVVKLDLNGIIQWQNNIGGDDGDWLYSVHQTTDGGFILGGTSRSNISGDKTENNWDLTSTTWDYWVLKLDTAGYIQWQNTIGGNGEDDLSSVQQTIDGGYIVSGFSKSDSTGDKNCHNWGDYDYWIVKLDSSGNIQWQVDIGGNGNDRLTSIQQTNDGGYILGGYSDSDSSGIKTENSHNGSPDYWVVKIDSSGSIQWQNTIGGDNTDGLFSIRQAYDGGFILGGHSGSSISGDKTENCRGDFDYWVIRLNSSGNVIWDKTIGGDDVDYLYSFLSTSDGGYILGGSSISNISGDKTENSNGDWDYWIVKLFPDTITSIAQVPNPQSPFSIYPNPASESIVIHSESIITKIEICNLLGEQVYHQQLLISDLRLPTSGLPNGLYIIKAYTEKGVFQQKLIIVHP